MTRRYFAANLPLAGGIVSLDESESHHATTVLRIRAGEAVTLFDGNGHEAVALVHTITRREVICESSAAVAVDRENRLKLTMGVAMPKGDRAKELVERLTELGVNCLVPVHCERTQWPVTENAIEKWRKVVIDACKQSGRNQLMRIVAATPLITWLTQAADRPELKRYLAHPTCDTEFATLSNSDPISTQPTTACQVAIGPEGGFSDAEVALAETNHWQRLALGNRRYRIETAAILAAIKVANL